MHFLLVASSICQAWDLLSDVLSMVICYKESGDKIKILTSTMSHKDHLLSFSKSVKLITDNLILITYSYFHCVK